MNYYEFFISGALDNDILVAIMLQWPFESFMEEEDGVKAYLPENEYNDMLLEDIIKVLSGKDLNFDVKFIPERNWNEAWEHNFDPVSVGTFCYLRASFHDPGFGFKYEIVINPKMSFGTGHHETTHQMIEMMEAIELKDKLVLDYGTGTGILAILAKMMGAKSVDAIDNDENSVENAAENIKLNDQHDISLRLSELENPGTEQAYDVILANINKNILWESADVLSQLLNKNGVLLISGFLEDQKEALVAKFMDYGFEPVDSRQKGEWICMKYFLK